MFVYGLSDPRTNELRYVGQTIYPLKKRLREHFKDCHKYTNHCAHWIKSLKNQGIVPVIEEIERCDTRESLNEAERFWISQFRALGFNLVNLADGGGGTPGRSIPDVQRAQISKKLGGRPIQDENGNVYLTKNEAAAKLGLCRQAITNTLKGGQKYAADRSGVRHTFSYVGEPIPQRFEWADELSVKHSRERGGRPIVDQNGVIYPNIAIASRRLGIRASCIRRVAEGERSRTGNYRFGYVDPQSSSPGSR